MEVMGVQKKREGGRRNTRNGQGGGKVPLRKNVKKKEEECKQKKGAELV
jgi:hypothetical protein